MISSDNAADVLLLTPRSPRMPSQEASDCFEKIVADFKDRLIQEHRRQLQALGSCSQQPRRSLVSVGGVSSASSQSCRLQLPPAKVPTSFQPALADFDGLQADGGGDPVASVLDSAIDASVSDSARQSNTPSVTQLRPLSATQSLIGGPRVQEGRVVINHDQHTEEGSASLSLHQMTHSAPLDRWRAFTIEVMSPKRRLQCFLVTARVFTMRQEFFDVLHGSTNDGGSFEMLARETANKCVAGRSSQSFLRRSEQSQSSIKTLGFVLHPAGRTRLVWLSLSILFLFYDICMVPLYWSFDLEDSDVTTGIALMSRVFWTLDIIMSFLTAVFVNGGLETRLYYIGCRYFKTWLAFDLLILAIDWLVMILWDSSAGFITNTLRVLRCLRILRGIRQLWWANAIRKEMQATGTTHYEGIALYLGLVKMLVAIVIWLHFLACYWHGIGVACENGWVERDRNRHRSSDDVATKVYWYFTSVHWALAQIHGSSHVHPANTLERVSAVLTLFSGFLLFSWFIAKITYVVLHATDLDAVELVRICDRFMTDKGVSVETAQRAGQYVKNHCKQMSLTDQIKKQTELLLFFPTSLRADILLEVRGAPLTIIGFFTDLFDCHRRAVRQICAEGVAVGLALRDEMFFSKGDPCTRSLILETGMLRYQIANLKAHTTHPAFTAFTAFGSLDILSSLYFASKGTSSSDVPGENEVQAYGSQHVSPGRCVSEAGLWVKWTHLGDLHSLQDSTTLCIDIQAVLRMIFFRNDVSVLATMWAKKFVSQLNMSPSHHSDMFQLSSGSVVEDDESSDSQGSDMEDVEDSHLIFLSHYKAEAGTEATLIQELLVKLIQGNLKDVAAKMRCPVFLDSEDLKDLRGLRAHVTNTWNLIFILTPGVLTRPWCLVELVTAIQHNIRVVPVHIQRPGLRFEFPDDEFYSRLTRGELLSPQALEVLCTEDIEIQDVEMAIRSLFMQIALPFSPHKSQNIRQAELLDILKRCSYDRGPSSIVSNGSYPLVAENLLSVNGAFSPTCQ